MGRKHCIARLAERFETPDFLLNCSKANRHLKMNFVNFNLKTWRVLICPLFSTFVGFGGFAAGD